MQMVSYSRCHAQNLAGQAVPNSAGSHPPTLVNTWANSPAHGPLRSNAKPARENDEEREH